MQKTLKALFEVYLSKNIPKVENSIHPDYEDAMQNIMTANGKRFRPLLYLSVVNSYEPMLINNAMPVALGIEMLHTYSLIHDDLPAMDNADTRRGIETLHKTYNDGFAILIGDALLSECFYKISTASFSDEAKIDLIREISLNCGSLGMVYGQAIDLYYENKSLDKKNLELLHTNKTAKFIASSLKMGAISCNLDIDYQNKLYDFGIKLGILFQIQDDILDVSMSEKEALKSINKDENKNSFVGLLGLDGAKKEADLYRDEILQDIHNLDDNLQKSLLNYLEGYINKHN